VVGSELDRIFVDLNGKNVKISGNRYGTHDESEDVIQKENPGIDDEREDAIEQEDSGYPLERLSY